MAYLMNNLSQGFQVDFLVLKDEPFTLEICDSIKVITRNCYSYESIVGKHFLEGIKGLWRMKKAITEEIKKCQPDLVICFDLRVMLAVSLCNLNKEIKLLFSERADPYENPKYWAYILRKIYKKVNCIVFQTEGAQGFYGEIVLDKSFVIPNPALARGGQDIKREDFKSKKVIFSAGRLQYRKGFDILIEAFAKVAEKYSDYTVIIYGDGPEKASLGKLIANLQLEERIKLLPPENNVVEHNVNADLFVIPSRSEGIPNILIEAMMANIPAIATDCSPGGARLLSDDGRVCLLAKNDDVDSLAENLDYALGHMNEMNEMAKCAYKSLERFDKELISSKWIEVISGMILC